MIVDLDTVESQVFPDENFDVCIVGGGPAGIVTASELSKSGYTVALCEAGGMEFDEKSQSCYEGQIVSNYQSLWPLDASRLRFFGGATGHWGGYCRPFTSIDFSRDYIDNGISSWPITLEEINTYSKRAGEILNIRPEFKDDKDESVPFRNVEFQFSNRVFGNFRENFIDEFKNSQSLQLFLNANLVGINGKTQTIETAEFANYNMQLFKIRARKFIFAMGGIETSRIMLWFAQKYGNKFFNTNTPIGKYWMEHPGIFRIGVSVQKSLKQEYPLERFHGGRFGSYLISDEIQRQKKIFGCLIWIEDNMNEKDQQKTINNFRNVAPKFSENVIDESKSEYSVCKINLNAEQQPSENNYIDLSSTEKDKFGIPRVVLNWGLSKIDVRTLETAVSEYIQYITENDIGRVHSEHIQIATNKSENYINIGKSQYTLKNIRYYTNHHHMGGLRMFENDKFGVVDSNCKVFGSENLYICGSSIFTTGSAGNPTFPIIQFSLRLSEHLKQIM